MKSFWIPFSFSWTKTAPHRKV